MVSVQTWGVDQTYVQSHTAEHIEIGTTSAMITTARLTVMIEAAAARVNGMITGVWGEDAVANFAAGATTSNQGASVYANIQLMVMERLWPMLLAAAHSHPPVAEEIDDLEARLRIKVQDLKVAPQDLGDTTDTTWTGRGQTSTAYLGLDTSTERAAYNGWTDPTDGRRRKHW